jgi:hypothetical protein
VDANGGRTSGDTWTIRSQTPETQAVERFTLADLMRYWNPDWKLQRAGIGGAGGGMGGLRGITHLDGDVLATYPRDEVRGLVITRTVTLPAGARLKVDVAADSGRAWALDVYAGNTRIESKIIEGGGGADRSWQIVEIPIKGNAGKPVTLRLMQRVLLGPKYSPGNAYWRNLRIE